MPGRYAKAEISSGLIGPVEVFAYRAPGTEPVLAPDTEVSRISNDDSEGGGDADPGDGGMLDVSALL
jgi:hypothetical protein